MPTFSIEVRPSLTAKPRSPTSRSSSRYASAASWSGPTTSRRWRLFDPVGTRRLPDVNWATMVSFFVGIVATWMFMYGPLPVMQGFGSRALGGQDLSWLAGSLVAAALYAVPGTRAQQRYEASVSLMSHQSYGPRVAVPRILRLLERQDVRATFFVPGFTAHGYPDTVRAIRDAGHETGHHGYLHEPMQDIDAATAARYLDRGLHALKQVVGIRPVA